MRGSRARKKTNSNFNSNSNYSGPNQKNVPIRKQPKRITRKKKVNYKESSNSSDNSMSLQNSKRRNSRRSKKDGLVIVPSEFSGVKGGPSDFFWEIDTNAYPNTLYIFNDNVEDHFTSIKGGGNGSIRIFNRHSGTSPVRSAGICTGESSRLGGFSRLTDKVRYIINRDIQEIRQLLKTGYYTQVKFSSDGKGGLATDTFKVGNTVKEYIIESIYGLKEWYDNLKDDGSVSPPPRPWPF